LKGKGNAHTDFREREPQLRNKFLDWGQGCKSIKKGKRALATSLWITVRKPTLSRLRPGPGMILAPPKTGLVMVRWLHSKDQVRPFAKVHRWCVIPGWTSTSDMTSTFQIGVPSEGVQTKPKVRSHTRRHRFIWR